MRLLKTESSGNEFLSTTRVLSISLAFSSRSPPINSSEIHEAEPLSGIIARLLFFSNLLNFHFSFQRRTVAIPYTQSMSSCPLSPFVHATSNSSPSTKVRLFSGTLIASLSRLSPAIIFAQPLCSFKEIAISAFWMPISTLRHPLHVVNLLALSLSHLPVAALPTNSPHFDPSYSRSATTSNPPSLASRHRPPCLASGVRAMAKSGSS
mmetsp:Transcript_156/g.127  ORF Transcript_156/g.127 Transcript_156/m.127 type:complete len:208 (-) Transcript_156:351-974(-)